MCKEMHCTFHVQGNSYEHHMLCYAVVHAKMNGGGGYEDACIPSDRGLVASAAETV